MAEVVTVSRLNGAVVRRVARDREPVLVSYWRGEPEAVLVPLPRGGESMEEKAARVMRAVEADAAS